MFQGTSENLCDNFDYELDTWAQGTGKDCGLYLTGGGGWINYYTLLIFDTKNWIDRTTAALSFGKC